MTIMLLVIDNYDSFTYNLVQYLGELGAEVVVHRNDAITIEEIDAMAPSAMVLSPGPCAPAQAGITVEAIRALGDRIPTLGVCLGHQAIGEAYGGRVVRAARAVHGKTSRIAHDGSGLFAGLPSPLEVGRYHSLVVERSSLPAGLQVVATSVDDPAEIHALRHETHPVWGVQFHPESVLTPNGKQLLRNFLDIVTA
jgi:anthranilate synthase component 2